MRSEDRLIELYRREYMQANPGATETQFQGDLREYKRRRLSTVGMSMEDRLRVLNQPRSEWSTAGAKIVNFRGSWAMSSLEHEP